MSSHTSPTSPWPQQTPPAEPAPQRPLKRRRAPEPAFRPYLFSRQIIADERQIQEAQERCQFNSGNDVISCFPTDDTSIPQHQWATFVWNSRLPEFTQTNLVNIYLFHGDSLQEIRSWTNQTNPTGNAGVIRAQVDDDWWGDRGVNWNGSNISYPFYWVITRADKELDGTETTQPVFRAVQTTFADSVLASMASSSSSAASASSAMSASLSSLSSVSATATAPIPSGSGEGGEGSDGNPGGVQSGNSGSDFPRWAIAVIVVLGFLAIATTCILAFFIIRRIRRRNLDSNRNSMGSASPMMAHVDNQPNSPLLAGGAAAAGAAGVDRHSSTGHGGPGGMNDGASTVSRAASAGDHVPFSGADAAIMADAFRAALRKPDFANRPVEEGESPDTQPEGETGLISRELAEEGRDIRSVSSSRGVRVETLSDSGDTVHDSRTDPHSH